MNPIRYALNRLRHQRQSLTEASTRFGTVFVPPAPPQNAPLRRLVAIGVLITTGGSVIAGTLIVRGERSQAPIRLTGQPVVLPTTRRDSVPVASLAAPDTSTKVDSAAIKHAAAVAQVPVLKLTSDFPNIDPLLTAFQDSIADGDSTNAWVTKSRDPVVHYAFATFLQSREDYPTAIREYRRFVTLARRRFSNKTIARVRSHIDVLQKFARPASQ